MKDLCITVVALSMEILVSVSALGGVTGCLRYFKWVL